jgi:adenylate kinase family enzyme
MSPKTFIFIGRSGCGKGTQAKLLKEYIEQADPDSKKIMYLETGPRFREFIKGQSFSGRLAAGVAALDGKQPDFLAVWNWAHVMIEEMTGQEHLIVDGTPRSYQEALVFDSAVSFYKRENPVVVYIDVSRDWSKQHLMARAKIEGREDDKNVELIEQRLTWFDTAIYPAVKYFETHPGYKFLHVNGEQSMEAVAHDIMTRLSW